MKKTPTHVRAPGISSMSINTPTIYPANGSISKQFITISGLKYLSDQTYPHTAQNPAIGEKTKRLKATFSGCKNPKTPVSVMSNFVPSIITVNIIKTIDYIIICQYKFQNRFNFFCSSTLFIFQKKTIGRFATMLMALALMLGSSPFLAA